MISTRKYDFSRVLDYENYITPFTVVVVAPIWTCISRLIDS